MATCRLHPVGVIGLHLVVMTPSSRLTGDQAAAPVSTSHPYRPVTDWPAPLSGGSGWGTRMTGIIALVWVSLQALGFGFSTSWLHMVWYRGVLIRWRCEGCISCSLSCLVCLSVSFPFLYFFLPSLLSICLVDSLHHLKSLCAVSLWSSPYSRSQIHHINQIPSYVGDIWQMFNKHIWEK